MVDAEGEKEALDVLLDTRLACRQQQVVVVDEVLMWCGNSGGVVTVV